MKKRVIAFVMIIAILGMLAPVGLWGSKVYAATSTAGYQKIQELKNTEACRIGKSYGNGGCWSFVNAFCNAFYGTGAPRGTNGYSLDYPGDYNLIGRYTVSSGNLTNERVKALLKKAYPGDIIQFCALPTASGGQHTAVIEAVSDEGVTIFDHVSELGVRSRYYSWTNFFRSELGTGYASFTRNQDGISLYHYKYYPYDSNSNNTNTEYNWDIKNPDTYPAYPNDYFSINHNGTYAYYVKFIQAGLKELGYSLDVDGSFGYGTRDVVLQYQRDNGMEVDGNFGPGSWSKLIQLLNNKFKNNNSSTTPPTTNNEYDWDITKPSTYPAYPNDYFAINHNGTKAYYVKFIQSGLKQLGYSIDVDGSFGYGTRDVVLQYQRDNGLEVDGNFGPGSWNKLIELLKNKFKTTTTTAQTNKTITITQQPNNQNAKAGATVKLSVKASGTGLKYQWYYKKSGAKSWTKWSNKTKATVSFKMAKGWNKAQFYCLVKNSSGKSVKTQSVKVTLIEELKISTQPKNKSVKTGKSASFSIKASGSNLSYQWYYKKKGAKSWTKWSGKTNASVSLKATKSWNGAQFYCQVKDGYNQSVKSKSAKLTVKK